MLKNFVLIIGIFSFFGCKGENNSVNSPPNEIKTISSFVSNESSSSTISSLGFPFGEYILFNRENHSDFQANFIFQEDSKYIALFTENDIVNSYEDGKYFTKGDSLFMYPELCKKLNELQELKETSCDTTHSKFQYKNDSLILELFDKEEGFNFFLEFEKSPYKRKE